MRRLARVDLGAVERGHEHTKLEMNEGSGNVCNGVFYFALIQVSGPGFSGSTLYKTPFVFSMCPSRFSVVNSSV